jgi:hypothetical protein
LQTETRAPMLRRAFISSSSKRNAIHLIYWCGQYPLSTPINKYRRISLCLFIYLLHGVSICAIPAVRRHSWCWLCALLLLMRSVCRGCRRQVAAYYINMHYLLIYLSGYLHPALHLPCHARLFCLVLSSLSVLCRRQVEAHYISWQCCREICDAFTTIRLYKRLVEHASMAL